MCNGWRRFSIQARPTEQAKGEPLQPCFGFGPRFGPEELICSPVTDLLRRVKRPNLPQRNCIAGARPAEASIGSFPPERASSSWIIASAFCAAISCYAPRCRRRKCRQVAKTAFAQDVARWPTSFFTLSTGISGQFATTAFVDRVYDGTNSNPSGPFYCRVGVEQ
jgi:hypothetical protein